MTTFLLEHWIEVIFGLISAGVLALAKYLHSLIKKYKELTKRETDKVIDGHIDEKIQPIYAELEELRKYAREVDVHQKAQMDLIVSSYKFRLVQLCREFIKQGFITQAQFDQLTEFYKLYHSLGGNSQADEYYEKASELEIR